jgi:hypothetical protein
MKVLSVTTSRPSPRTAAPPCLPLGIKDSLKEEKKIFVLRLLLWGLLLLDFWLFGVGGFWKGKELLKGNC